PTVAAELFEHALRLTPPGDSAGARRALDAAEAHRDAGNADRTLTLLRGLAEELPAGAERAEALFRLAAVEGKRVLCEAALREPGLTAALQARIHAELAWLAPDVRQGLCEAGCAASLTPSAESRTALAFMQAVAGEP